MLKKYNKIISAVLTVSIMFSNCSLVSFAHCDEDCTKTNKNGQFVSECCAKDATESFTNLDFSSSTYHCSSLTIGPRMLHLVPIISILQSYFIRDIKLLLNFAHKMSIRQRFMLSSGPDTMSSTYVKTSHLVAPVRSLPINWQVNALKV